MNNILIFTEGGKEYGFGHISRTSSLYYEFKSRGYEIKFIVKGTISSEFLDDISYVNIDWTIAEVLYNIFKDEDVFLSIVDSYTSSFDILSIINKFSNKCIYIDDYKRINYPKGSIILNSSIYAEDLNYSNDNINLLGIKYCLLRPDFKKYLKYSKRIKKEVDEILITLGGSDVMNLTPRVLEILVEKYPFIKKNVVVGSGFNNIQEIEMVKDNNTYIVENAGCAKMIDLMIKSDIAISSGGQTMYELGFLNVPSIAINTIENQEKNVRKLKDLSCAKCMDLNEIENIALYVQELFEFEKRLNLSNNMKSIFRYYGAERVADFIIKRGDFYNDI